MAGQRDSNGSLAIRAAWLHYVGGLTQSEVAGRLGVSAVKAHRLIAWANQNGAVKVSIDGEVAECAALERQLCERFGLAHCEVVPDLGEGGLPLRALGTAGAAFLQREVEAAGNGVIGMGNGRTLAAAVALMPRLDCAGTRFVSLLGGLTRNFAANPHDVMHRLAEKTSGTAYVMPVPFFANSAEDRDVFLSQRGVGEVRDLASRAAPMIVGLGTAEPDAQLVYAGVINKDELAEVRKRGGVGEMLGHFFDARGRLVETDLTARTVAPEPATLVGRQVVAIAGGMAKVAGIRAVLLSGYLSSLITDERTARTLAEATRAAGPRMEAEWRDAIS